MTDASVSISANEEAERLEFFTIMGFQSQKKTTKKNNQQKKQADWLHTDIRDIQSQTSAVVDLQPTVVSGQCIQHPRQSKNRSPRLGPEVTLSECIRVALLILTPSSSFCIGALVFHKSKIRRVERTVENHKFPLEISSNISFHLKLVCT